MFTAEKLHVCYEQTRRLGMSGNVGKPLSVEAYRPTRQRFPILNVTSDAKLSAPMSVASDVHGVTTD